MRAGRCAFLQLRDDKQVRLSSWRKLVMRNRRLWFVLVSLMSAATSARAQDARSTSADGDQLPEAESVVVWATRFHIPLVQSPAIVSVLVSVGIEQKQVKPLAAVCR